jgi:hypothetical protein
MGFLQETQGLLKTSREASYKKSKIPYPAIEMILQAAIFKTSALLEEYIKNSINDWIYLAHKENCSAGSLPMELRWYYISVAHVDAYRSYINNKDEKRLLTNLISKKENCLFQDNHTIKKIIKPSIILGNKKYPSVKNIKRLFTRLGIGNIFPKIDKKTKRQYEPLVKSFQDIRQAIAHQNPPDLTYNDIKNHINNIQGFVSALDRVLFSHIVSYHGMKCWRSKR